MSSAPVIPPRPKKHQLTALEVSAESQLLAPHRLKPAEVDQLIEYYGRKYELEYGRQASFDISREVQRLLSYEYILFLVRQSVSNSGGSNTARNVLDANFVKDVIRPGMEVSQRKHQYISSLIAAIPTEIPLDLASFRLGMLSALTTQPVTEESFLVISRQCMALFNLWIDEVNALSRQPGINLSSLFTITERLRVMVQDCMSAPNTRLSLTEFQQAFQQLHAFKNHQQKLALTHSSTQVLIHTFAALFEMVADRNAEMIDALLSGFMDPAKRISDEFDDLFNFVNSLRNLILSTLVFVTEDVQIKKAQRQIRDLQLELAAFVCLDEMLHENHDLVLLDQLLPLLTKITDRFGAVAQTWLQLILGCDEIVKRSYFRVQTLLNRYYIELPDLQFPALIKYCLMLYFHLTPLFMNPVGYPITFPLPSNSGIQSHSCQFHHLSRQVQYSILVQALKSIHESGQDIEMRSIDHIREAFLEEMRIETTFVVPALTSFLARRDIWHLMIKPTLNQFRAEIMQRLDQSFNSERRLSTGPTLDAAMLKIISDLHEINHVVHDMSIALLSTSELNDAKTNLPLFDVDALVAPYLDNWMRMARIRLREVVERCVIGDQGECQDETLNISSAPSDLITYIRAMVDIVFALPYDASQAGKTTPASQCLKGVDVALAKHIVTLARDLAAAVSNFAELCVHKRSGIDLDDPSFEVFRRKRAESLLEIPAGDHRRLSGSSTNSGSQPSTPTRVGLRSGLPPVDKDLSPKYFRRINNLVYMGQMVHKHIEDVFQKTLVSRPTILTACSADSQLVDTLDLNDAELLKRRFDEVFQPIFNQVHIDLKASVLKLTNYMAKRLVYIDLREDFIDGLYATGDIGMSSIQSISPIIVGLIEEIFGFVIADRFSYKTDFQEENTERGESLSHAILVLFFRNFMNAYECIVLLDLHSGRTLGTHDLPVLLKDMTLMETLFSVPHSEITFDMLHTEGVRSCIKPIREIIRALVPVETNVLIKMYDVLLQRERKEQQRIQLIKKPVVDGVKVTVQDVVSLCEYEEYKEIRRYFDPEEQQARKIRPIIHPIAMFLHGAVPEGGPKLSTKSVPPPVPPRRNITISTAPVANASVQSPSTNPFMQDLIDSTNPFASSLSSADPPFQAPSHQHSRPTSPTLHSEPDMNPDLGGVNPVWSSIWVRCMIAKRAGYGGPKYNQGVTSLATPLKASMKQVAHKMSGKVVSGSGTGLNPMGGGVGEVDQDAVMFMKKAGMKKWFGIE